MASFSRLTTLAPSNVRGVSLLNHRTSIDCSSIFSSTKICALSLNAATPSTPSVSPPQAANPSTVVDFANLIVQVCAGVIAFVTLLIAIAAFFGIREASLLRKLNKETRTILKKAEATRTALEARLETFALEFESLVLAAHLFNEGQSAYNATDYDKAIIFYEDALKLQPDNSKIMVRLARALTNKGMNSRAERYLRSATQKDPSNAAAWIALSTTRRYVDLPEAISFAEKAIELDEKSLDAWNYLGLLMRDARRYEEALNAHEEAQRINPLDAITCFYRALLLFKLGNKLEAKHAIYEAFAQSQTLQKTGRIKKIWAQCVEWGYRRSLDTVSDDQAALEIAVDLAAACKESRNRQALISHFAFYVAANGETPENDVSILAFPASEVKFILERM